MTIGPILLAFVLSVVGGIIGALLLGVARGAPVTHNVDWGTLVGGIAAALAALFVARRAVVEYMQRQERDEVSRRFVDEGIDRLGRELAAAYSVHINNLRMLGSAAIMAKVGDREGTLARLQASTPAPTPARFEAARLHTQIKSEPLMGLFDRVFGDFDDAISYASEALPSMLRATLGIEDDELRQEVAERVLVIERITFGKLQATQRLLLDGLAELSMAFQAALVARTSQALDWSSIRALREPLARFEEKATQALAERERWEDTPQLREWIRSKRQAQRAAETTGD